MASVQNQSSGKKEAPGGSWPSPISSELIVSQSIGLGSPTIADDGRVYWIEGRPTEGGRSVLVSRSPQGAVADVMPGADSGYNARTRVHEYGGGETCVGPSGAVYWSNFKDQRVYKQQVQSDGSFSSPEPLTAADGGLRYADAVVDVRQGRLLAVQEDHSREGEPSNHIAAVDLKTGKGQPLTSGQDFYAAPRLSPSGKKLAWISWNHPNMPWDDTELWCADIAADSPRLDNIRKVAGGPGESVVQPLWCDDTLSFISDRTDWWNIYTETGPGQVKPLVNLEAEFAPPAWMFGGRSYQPLPGGRFLAAYSAPEKAGMTLAVIQSDGAVHELQTPYASFGNISVREVNGKLMVATVGGSPKKPSEVALLTVDDVQGLISSKPSQWQSIKKASSAQVDAAFLSQPESIAFPTTGGQTAYMNHYPPTSGTHTAPGGAPPPLLVKIHGGPTAAASTNFSLGIQFWTSRGYAVADVNYGGSTGYGRKYRKRLEGQWGVVDVDDCCAAATYLADKGLADPKKLCITGGSAGGYTTLACLAFRKVFSAGASHYGVADLQLLAQETHKFESRYLDGLIGRWPEDKKVYEERSPINSLQSFDAPVAFFQGEEDKVVPPNQAVDCYEALKKRGLPTTLVMFPGEQHGFRQGPNIRRALDGELFFYGTTLPDGGFPVSMPPGLQPPDIVNT